MDIFLLIISLIFFLVSYAYIEHQRMKKIASERGQANICEFARSFDYRNVDTKIIREVWNELLEYIGKYDGNSFPVRSDDSFKEIYNFDDDDLDDIYWAVADRLGIDTECAEKNPYFDKVTSVKNLVLFLNHQPKLAAPNKALKSDVASGAA